MMRCYYSPIVEKTYEIPEDLVPPDPRCVLLLEDDATLADALRNGLELNHYAITRVRNGAEGVQRILNRDFDFILCDMVMPGFPGDMFYRAVERSRPHLCRRFLFMTGHRGDPHIDDFIRRVGGVVLWKPFQLHELLDALKVVARKSTAESCS